MIRKESYSSKVATTIEYRIRNGTYVAGNPLPSIRELTGDFGVSRQVIQDAIDSLRDRGILISRQRIGVFVNPGILPVGIKQMVVLYSGTRMNEQSYSESNFQTNNFSLYPNVDIVSKRLPVETINSNAFWYEIDKITELKPDCLLVSIHHLNVSSIKRLDKLPFPVVFAGDFFEGKGNQLGCNQLCESLVEKAKIFIDAAIKLNSKKVGIIAGSLDRWYAKEFRKHSSRLAAENNIEFKYYEYGDNNAETVDEITAVRSNFIDSLAMEADLPDSLIFDNYWLRYIFCEKIRQRKLETGRNIVFFGHEVTTDFFWLYAERNRLAEAVAVYLNQIMADHDYRFNRVVFSGLLEPKLLKIEKFK